MTVLWLMDHTPSHMAGQSSPIRAAASPYNPVWQQCSQCMQMKVVRALLFSLSTSLCLLRARASVFVLTSANTRENVGHPPVQYFGTMACCFCVPCCCHVGYLHKFAKPKQSSRWQRLTSGAPNATCCLMRGITAAKAANK